MLVTARRQHCWVSHWVLVALLGVVGCQAASERGARRRIVLECAISEELRWGPPGKQSVVIEVDSAATVNMGIAAIGDTLYLFDRPFPRILIAERSGYVRAAFARGGRGPGEILPPTSAGRVLPKGRRATWIDADSNIAAFDGTSIHWYDAAGRHVVDVSGLTQASIGPPPLFSSRIRVFDGGVLLDVESLVPPSTAGAGVGRRFDLWHVRSDTIVRVFDTPLVPFPTRGPQGAPHSGITEASPLWDLYGRCVVFSDGGSALVRVVRIESQATDTLDLRLPDREPAETWQSGELLARIGRGNAPPPAPALPKRVRQLIIDPDGWLWVEPVQPANLFPSVEVWRTHLESGTFEIDTVPVFPIAFLKDGAYAGIITDSLGTMIPRIVVR